jgi:hypothetical protein
MIMNVRYRRIREEAIVACFRMQSQNTGAEPKEDTAQ